MNLTILIATKNRYPALFLTLQFIKESGFDGQVIVADSSDNQITIRDAFPQENIRQINCVGKNIEESLYLGALEVKTKYIAYSGDDDFLIYSGLKRCVSFLDMNEAYAACTAVGGYLVLNQMHRKFNVALPYKTQGYEGGSPLDRLRSMLTDYAAPWCVYRTALLVESLKVCSSFRVPRAREIYLLFDTLLNGKLKKLSNCVYVIRGIHNKHFKYPVDPDDVDLDVYSAVAARINSNIFVAEDTHELIMQLAEFHCKRSSASSTTVNSKFLSMIQITWLNFLLFFRQEKYLIKVFHQKFYDESKGSLR